MFGQARYLQNSFSIAFQRQTNIRRRANEFEDKLKENPDLTYSQPQVIPIPDDLDPEIPRLIFGSKRGSSQIIISQLSMTLNVIYTPDWQIDILRGRKYLTKRVEVLFNLLKILDGIKPFFAGLTTTVQLSSKVNDVNIIKHLADIFVKKIDVKQTHDIQIKFTTVLNQNYYSNLTIQNYRTWSIEEAQSGLPRLSKYKASDRGIQIMSDFNDRYAFNERGDYFTSKNTSEEIIEIGFREIEKTITKVRGQIS